MISDFNTDHDNEMRIKLKTKLQKSSINVYDNLMLKDSYPSVAEYRKFHLSMLKICDGVIIFFNSKASKSWLIQTQMELYKALIAIDRISVFCAIFIDDSDVEVKMESDFYYNFSVITKENLDEEVKKISNLLYNE